MFCRSHLRALFLFAALAVAAPVTHVSAQNSYPPPQIDTRLHLRWGEQTGVSRYRLQLALDAKFVDIVFDRVVTGHEIVIDELAPGRYFWRIAPLRSRLGQFSSAALIEVHGQDVTPQLPSTGDIKRQQPTNAIVAGGGWRAAVGDIDRVAVAHLRSPDTLEIVGTNSDGVTFAIDALNGVALWTVRPESQSRSSVSSPLVIPSRSRLDNVLIFRGAQAIAIEGASGRELWRAALPAPANSGAVISDRNGSQAVLLDNTLQRLTILSAIDGRIVSQTRLPARGVGGPVPLAGQATSAFMISYDTGAIEIRDRTGTVVRSGSAGSSATTAPILVSSPRGDLILVGTREGLTALTARELRPLGRVALKDDAPSGSLTTQDLNGDGIPEALMMTAKHRVIAVNTSDGTIVWNAVSYADAEGFAFGDVNGDGLPDVMMAAGQSFAVALSGRDGAIIWKDNEPNALVANHAAGFAPRSLVALPSSSGTLLIGSDQAHTGLRAIAFPKAAVRPAAR